MPAKSTSAGRKKSPTKLDFGKKLLSWKAPDFEPYRRGLRWYVTFCSLTFGSALVIFLMDPSTSAVPVFSICVLAAVYLWVHKDGEKEHQICLFEKGLQVAEGKLMPWKDFEGFWFLEDKVSRLLILEHKDWKRGSIRLQLAKTKSEKVNKVFEKLEVIEHLEDKKESGFDLWSRVFRL